jgi:hypothetical protein
VLVLLVVQSSAKKVKEEEKVGEGDEPKLPLFFIPVQVARPSSTSNRRGRKGELVKMISGDFCIYIGGLECFGHSFAYVTLF